MATPASPKTRRWPFALFLVFLLGYNLFRVALFAMTQDGSVQPDRPLEPAVNAVVVYSELAIGVVGFVAVPGLTWSKAWGFWTTLAVSAYAIVFDAVSAFAVQSSAAGGVIPPVAILLVLFVFRRRFFPVQPLPAPPSAARA